MPEMRRAKMFRYARPTKFRFNKSTRLETRVTESPVGTFETCRPQRRQRGPDVSYCISFELRLQSFATRCVGKHGAIYLNHMIIII